MGDDRAVAERKKVLSCFCTQDFFSKLIGERALERRLHDARKADLACDLLGGLFPT